MDEKLIIKTDKNYGKSEPISFRISKRLFDKIEELMVKTGRSRSDIIEACIEFALPKIEIVEED